MRMIDVIIWINMNKITQKKESNSKLLQLLASRERQQVLPREDAWPGQRRPSFASTIRIKHKSQPPPRPQLSQRVKEMPLFSNNRLEMSRRNAKSVCAINTLSLRLKAAPKSLAEYATGSKSSFKGNYASKKLKSSESEQKVINIDSEDYVIDYLAFNFIGKVIDTPQLWAKYVHKKLAT